MKHLTITILALALVSNIMAQEKQETIKKEAAFKTTGNRTLWIDNISGSIEVEAYDGNTVAFEIVKHIRADNDAELTAAWKKLNPAIVNNTDTMEVYIDGYCDCDCDKGKGHYWHQCNNNDQGYDFNFDFKIQVPKDLNLWLSTINNGDITASGINGALRISNVNGGITLEKVSGATTVHTINGDVTIKYTKNPAEASKYYTLNGKMTVYFLPDLSADMSFKSFNGKFFTDFNIAETLPSQLVTSKDQGKGTKYKIEDKTAVRIGHGGVPLNFETFNGDIYIKKL